ncbi:MAG: hypothetical protein JNJ83_11900 [Verrucomicrobiaceae bacterium]|nr:hypothetical protein [Verrucomicrobiaceae bacterium]
MSWIKDIPDEVRALDFSAKGLRKFGLVVGGVFLALGLLVLWKRPDSIFVPVLIIPGVPLFVLGLLAPKLLRVPYSLWMTMAFFLGGIVSRIILTLMFFCIFVPFGILGRVLGLPFTKMRNKPREGSLWIERKAPTRESYEQLY